MEDKITSILEDISDSLRIMAGKPKKTMYSDIENMLKEMRQQEPINKQNSILFWTLLVLIITSIVDIILRIIGI